jgi:hypothetical protein
MTYFSVLVVMIVFITLFHICDGRKTEATNNKNGDENEKNDFLSRMNNFTKDLEERNKKGHDLALSTIRKSLTEECDWKVNPIAYLSGRVCGKHYKVLGFPPKDERKVDPKELKFRFRQKSLELHPDKNPSPKANDAFNIIRDAYECLSDASCKSNYDDMLAQSEQFITTRRKNLASHIKLQALRLTSKLHYYVSYAASVYNQG